MLTKRKFTDDEAFAVQRMSELEIAANLRPARAIYPLVERFGDDVNAIKQFCSASRDIRMACQDLEWYWRSKIMNNACRIYDQTKPSAFLRYITSVAPNYAGSLGRIRMTDRGNIRVISANCSDVFEILIRYAGGLHLRRIEVPTESWLFKFMDKTTTYEAEITKLSPNDNTIGFSQLPPGKISCSLQRNGNISLSTDNGLTETIFSTSTPFVACDFSITHAEIRQNSLALHYHNVVAVDSIGTLYIGLGDSSQLIRQNLSQVPSSSMPIGLIKTIAFQNSSSTTSSTLFLLNDDGKAYRARIGQTEMPTNVLPFTVPNNQRVIAISPAFFLLESGRIARVSLPVDARRQPSLTEIEHSHFFVAVRSIAIRETWNFVIIIEKYSGSVYFGIDNLGIDWTVLPETENSIDCGIFWTDSGVVNVCVVSASNQVSLFAVPQQHGTIERILKTNIEY